MKKKLRKKSANSNRTRLKAAIYIIAALILIIVTIVLNLYLSGSTDIFYLVAVNCLPAIASIIGLSGVWELFGKKSFAEEVLELSQVSESYIQSGILKVYENFNDIDWREYLNEVTQADFFFTYAYGWRSQNNDLLRKMIKQGATINVYLPDYEIEEIVNALDRDYAYGKYAPEGSSKAKHPTADRIKGAEEYFKEIGAKVWFFSGNIKHTYYFLDNKCIIALNKHGNEKTSVPAFVCQKGKFMYDFCKRDLERIKNESKEKA